MTERETNPTVAETRQDRRTRQREIARRVSKLTDQERAELARRVLATTIEGRTLSAHNLCLLAYQRPDATVIGGFRQWLKAGRAVKKGEHGAVIWFPIGRKSKDGDVEERTGFGLASVFDISQTEEVKP